MKQGNILISIIHWLINKRYKRGRRYYDKYCVVCVKRVKHTYIYKERGYCLGCLVKAWFK